MSFVDDKKRYLELLGKPDNSKKGGVDKDAWPLINAINKHPDFYTTSSCSGRISFLREPSDGRKDHAHWYFVSHEPTTAKDMLVTLDGAEGTVWFKFEGAIFHVVAKDEKAANTFLQAARDSGFKHSGLMATKKRFVIELFDAERIEVPVVIDDELIVAETFIEYLVEQANKKLFLTHERMARLEEAIKELQEK